MEPFTTFTSRVVTLPLDDVDTDQIIPARFLKVTDKRGLGDCLFADWRSRPGFALLAPDAAGAEILVAGANFGCGSSREHAPWALLGFGFRAVIARSFADIFQQNALKNGLVPVAVDERLHGLILAARARDPRTTLTIDLASCTVALQGGMSAPFALDPFARHCLMNGVDELGYLLSFSKDIDAYEAARGD